MQQKPIQLAFSAVNARIHNAPDDLRRSVSDLLSYKVDGAEMSSSFKNNTWDGYSTFYNFRKDTFPAGFVHMVYNHIVRKGYKVQIVRKSLPKALGPSIRACLEHDGFGFSEEYSYQSETVEKLEKHGQIIAQLATGAGKSRVARLAYLRILRPTLFLTTRSSLMHQMRDGFQPYLHEKIGILGDSEWRPTHGFNVGMVQTLMRRIEHLTYKGEISRRLDLQKKNEDKEADDLKKRLKRKRMNAKQISEEVAKLRKHQEMTRPSDKEVAREVQSHVDKHNRRREETIKLLETFELVISEEAHESSGNGYYDVLSHCKNAHYRLALTATPFMKTDEEANMRLMACSGPVAIKVSEEQLINLGILAKPYFKYESLKPILSLRRTAAWQKAYKVGIVENDLRNAKIVAQTVKNRDHGLTTMILVLHKEHGKRIRDALKAQGLNVQFIYGDHDTKERKAALRALESGSMDVLIGSTILDVGVDVPAVGSIILAGGGKAEVALRQRIGRGLRRKKNGPNVCFVMDFNDIGNGYLVDHAKQRKAIVENTPGFSDGILPSGEEFPYELFDRTS